MDRDERDVRALGQELLDAWNHRSAEGMARLFLRNAVVVGFDGSQMIGARAVERN